MEPQTTSLTSTIAESLGRLEPQSLPEMAAEKLRQAILTGRLKPGERLIQQKLAVTFGIGQPTLREALNELAHQGFVRRAPNTGTYVTRLTKDDYQKILEVRMPLEALAVRKATSKLTQADASELEEMTEAMEGAVKRSDLASFHQNDLAFHQKIWALSGNEYISVALEGMLFPLFAFGILERGSTGDTSELMEAAQCHRQILAGLRTGDSAKASEIFVRSVLADWERHHGIKIDPAVASGA